MINSSGVIILSFLAFAWTLDIIDAFLNVSALSEFIPVEFSQVFDPADYAKSQRYTKAKTWFSLASGAYSTVLFLVVWFMRGFNALDLHVRSLNWHPVPTGVLYLFAIGFASQLAGLPWSIYSDFVLEANYGFNQKTWKVFVKDLFLGLGLSVILGGPILAIILGFFQYFGSSAWAYCWIATTLFSLFVVFISPKYILPLFNKLDPLPDGELKNAIAELSSKLDFSFSGVFVMDGSKRSSHSNAFFTGFGSTKRIVLYDTLIKQQDQDEIVAILGHEIGHYKMRHIIWGIVLSTIQQGMLFFLMQYFITSQALAEAFFMDNVSVYTGLIFFSQLFAPIDLVSKIFFNLRSRSQEFEADRYSVEKTGKADALISGLKKLCKENLSNLTPHWFHVFLEYTHPPMLQRVQAIREFQSSLKKLQ